MWLHCWCVHTEDERFRALIVLRRRVAWYCGLSKQMAKQAQRGEDRLEASGTVAHVATCHGFGTICKYHSDSAESIQTL